MKAAPRVLPSVDQLLRTAELKIEYPRILLVTAARETLSGWRKEIQQNGAAPPDISQLALETAQLAQRLNRSTFQIAINATGVVLHTGLGRAVLSKAARDGINIAASGHSTVEIDLEMGKRGNRQLHVEKLLTILSGSEAAIAVNNNAAAVLLCVNTFAMGKSVIISRGQLVEIGGSFRMPEIIKQAGANLVEVGSTNRTRISDYSKAINKNTGLIIRCHPSNFKMSGFTEETELLELSALAKKNKIPLLDDVGSGCYIDLTKYGLDHEPTIQESVKAGCEMVSWSGDKLLGGPQAGIIEGKTKYIKQLAANPIARALRIDKLSVAGLEATLRLYLNPELADKTIPTYKYIARSLSELKAMASEIIDDISIQAKGIAKFEIIHTVSETGGGSLPGQKLPTAAVSIIPNRMNLDTLARKLRLNYPPIFTRIEKGKLLIDPRTLEHEEIKIVVNALNRVLDE